MGGVKSGSSTRIRVVKKAWRWGEAAVICWSSKQLFEGSEHVCVYVYVRVLQQQHSHEVGQEAKADG